jgi:phospholipase C
MAALDGIGTIVVVMMENRSFDHMLGYLSLIDPTMKVDGLVAPFGSSVDYRKPLAHLQNDIYLEISSADGELHYPGMTNMQLGTTYINLLLSYCTNTTAAVAAYNAGPTASTRRAAFPTTAKLLIT